MGISHLKAWGGQNLFLAFGANRKGSGQWAPTDEYKVDPHY